MSMKISIITVCFNCVNDIKKTIESVLDQDYTNIEYILIDGGSNDGTIDIIEEYRNQIDIFISEPDNGIFDAMNKGLKLSSGLWVNFMNAGDNFYHNQTISEVFKNRNLQDISVLYGSTLSMNKIRPPHRLSILKYGGIMACHQSVFYNIKNCGKELFYKTKHKHYGDIELTRRLYLKKFLFKKVDVTVASYLGGGFSSVISKDARLAKFDYLYDNMGALGIVYGIYGKVKYLVQKYV